MNEKIKELWNKTCGEIHPEMDGICMTNQRGQKFAKLIVQECIDMISPYSVRMSRPGEEYLHPIQEIKEHFGVEE